MFTGWFSFRVYVTIRDLSQFARATVTAAELIRDYMRVLSTLVSIILPATTSTHRECQERTVSRDQLTGYASVESADLGGRPCSRSRHGRGISGIGILTLRTLQRRNDSRRRRMVCGVLLVLYTERWIRSYVRSIVAAPLGPQAKEHRSSQQ